MRNFLRSLRWLARIIPVMVDGLPAKYEKALADMYDSRAQVVKYFKKVEELQAELTAARIELARRQPGGFRMVQQKRAS